MIQFPNQNALKRLKQLLVMVSFIIFLLAYDISLIAQSVDGVDQKVVATFSIVARDSVTGELGVAVASKFFAVGSVVPWAKADMDAVATQSYANTNSD